MPNTREELIELLREVQYQGNAVHGFHDKYIQNSELADHLIANGVTIPVRCKDCQWWKRKGLCPMYGLPEDSYCSYGERRNDV